MKYLAQTNVRDLQHGEVHRLHALRSLDLLDTQASEEFDRITRLAAALFNVPIAAVSLVDEDRQWFKSCVGLDVPETSRQHAFCDHAIRAAEVMVVENALEDPRFADNPLVTGESQFRFYAGAPLLLKSGEALGTLCLVDRSPRNFTLAEREQLQDLAAIVMTQIDLHRAAGRIDDITQLPNHAQMLEDLADLTEKFPDQPWNMVLIELMDHGDIRDATRAIGTQPIETIFKNTVLDLQQTSMREKSRLYCVDIGRLVLLTERSDSDFLEFMTQLKIFLKRPVANGNLFIELDAVVGTVRISLSLEETQEGLRKAMTAVHRARTTGHIHMVYEEEFDHRHQHAYAILRDLPQAMVNDELHLLFQPKLCLKSGVFDGVEALLRWNHPQLGNIPPSLFIPLAESTTLIHDITNWVLDAALSELIALNAQGFSVSMAVNVSARNLENTRFVAQVENSLIQHGIRPEQLHIECTEYSRMTNPEVAKALEEIRTLGIQLSLDDFGVGYSNLTCLETLPFQFLKIDRSLIMPITSNARTRQLLKGVVALGHSMGFSLVAEGVETAEVFQEISDLGFDHAQGYFLSRPLCAKALACFLKT